jgi:hypothetical protein
MIQFGQNAGPRHLRVFGYVRNLKDANITANEQVCKDARLLGVFGLVWNLIRTVSPKPVILACETAMDAAGMPRMGTKQDEKGNSTINLHIYFDKYF